MILRNIAANSLGMGVTVLTQAVLTIAAYRLAGAEQYGLIGFFGILLTGAAILDIGLGQTVVREMSRRRSAADASGQAAVLFTFQRVYGGLVVVVVIGLVSASPPIAHHWLKSGHIPVAEVRTAVALMGAAVGTQRLRMVYQSALDGMERQVLSNGLTGCANLLRLTLGLGALVFVSPTAVAYFAGQVVASIGETALFAFMAWRALPPPAEAPRRFDPVLLREAAAFAGTNAAGAALGMAIQLCDVIVVSSVVPLPVFGAYALASQICALMLRLTTPVMTAVLPRLSLYAREANRDALARLFFTSSRVMAGLLAGSVGVLACFGWSVLLVLTGKPALAQGFAPILTVLAGASALNGLSRAPHGLQLAEGDPATALRINLVIAIVYLPAAAILTPRFGIAAPASLLLIANGLGFLAFVWSSFSGSLRGLRRAWLMESVIRPVLAAGGVCIAVRLAVPASAAPVVQLSAAVAAWGLALAASAATPGSLNRRLVPRAIRVGRASLRFRASPSPAPLRDRDRR